jgi:hypothetical protein
MTHGRHHLRLIRPALTAALSLIALSACASTQSTTASFKPEGGSGSSAVSPSSAPAAEASVRNFPFGKDVHFDFQTALPSDPAERAAVIDDRDFQLARYYAIYSGKDSTTALSYLIPMDSSLKVSVYDNIHRYASWTITGTLVIYRTTVQPTTGGSPGEYTVTSCFNSVKQTALYRSGHGVVPGQNQVPADNTFMESDTWMPDGNVLKIGGIVTNNYPDGGSKACL